MGHGSYVVRRGSLLEYGSGSWVDVNNSLPALQDVHHADSSRTMRARGTVP